MNRVFETVIFIVLFFGYFAGIVLAPNIPLKIISAWLVLPSYYFFVEKLMQIAGII